MLKKEHLKQAIEAISRRDSEIAYVLDEMLSIGRISPLVTDSDTQDFHFTFDDQPATVKRIIFFDKGTVPIEERLLIKYGEMVKKRRLLQNGKDIDYAGVAREIRRAGLKFMVTHEIEYAVAQVQKSLPGRLAARLETIKKNLQPFSVSQPAAAGETGLDVFYQGTVNADKPACFVRFPFCMDTLMQVADINVEFFHVRFLLSCLARGLDKNLFACVVDNRIQGIVYLTFKEQYFYRALEIQYIATVRGRAPDKNKIELSELKGVGTFLVAGVWLLWKTHLTDVKDLLLDSEIGARRFYEAIGFQSRGFSGFAMKTPQGRLVTAILDLAGHLPDFKESAVREIRQIMKKQFKILRKRAASKNAESARKRAVESVKICLRSGMHPALAATARELLTQYRKKIPEAEALIRLAGGNEA